MTSTANTTKGIDETLDPEPTPALASTDPL